jgi:hypothetical protein
MHDEAMQRLDELDPSDDLEWLVEKHFDILQLPAQLYEDYANDPFITRALADIDEQITQHHAEKMLYISSPYKYYGLKEGDFL